MGLRRGVAGEAKTAFSTRSPSLSPWPVSVVAERHRNIVIESQGWRVAGKLTGHGCGGLQDAHDRDRRKITVETHKSEAKGGRRRALFKKTCGCYS